MQISEAMIKELIGRWENEALFSPDKSVTETLRMCADTLRMLLDVKLQPCDDPQYSPCPLCNSSGIFKYSPHKDCVCNGVGFMIKLGSNT